MQQEQTFKVERNNTVLIFELAWYFYCVLYTMLISPIFVKKTFTFMEIMQGKDEWGFWMVFISGLFISFYLWGFRAASYTVDRKTLTINYRVRKNKEINLMDCETICDPVPRFSEFMHRARAIEIYDYARKRIPFYPHDRLGFVEAVVRGNKRIHCTVKDYTDVHRATGRKLRKERRKEERAAARGEMIEEND